MGSSQSPPRVAEWLLGRILAPGDCEYILGDLASEYGRKRAGAGPVGAHLWYWRHLLQSVGPSARTRVGMWRARRRRPASSQPQRHRGEPMNAALRDLRFALRVLRRNKLFAAVTVATLALGIGANTAIFSVVRGILLEPLPYAAPSRLGVVRIHWEEIGIDTNEEGHSISQPELFDLRHESRFLEGVGAYYLTPVNVTGSEGDAERVPAAVLTADVFAILGVEAALGRTFTADEDQPTASVVALLGYDFWQRRYAGDPGILGSDVTINGRPCTVVGIMARGFRLPEEFSGGAPSQIWLPMRLDEDNLMGRGSHYLSSVARLAPAVTLEQTNAELAALAKSLTEQGLYRADGNVRFFVKPMSDAVVGDVRPALLVLFGAVGFVLLITCANVANLMLARAESRKRELAVRTALGARRGVLVRQLLTEAVILGLAGGAAGLVVARLGLAAVKALDPATVPRLGDVSLDTTVLTYATVVSLLTGLLFGLLPALRSGRVDDLQAELRGAARGMAGGGKRHRAQRALVGSQIGFAVMLVIGATLAMRSFGNLVRIDPGFDVTNVLTMRLSIPAATYPDAPAITGYYRRLLERIRALPGVEHAAAVRILPLAEEIGDWSIHIEGREPGPGEDFDGDWQVVTDGYFETMRIPLREGRFFDSRDRADGRPVIIVNEAMANLYWPDGALGQRIRLGGDRLPWLEIVGVVGDIRHQSLGGVINSKWYVSHEQFAEAVGFTPNEMRLVVRTGADPVSVVSAVRQEVRSLDPNVPVAGVETMEHILHASVAEPRFVMALLLVFGAVALVLAAVGVYGVISYSISERTHELGLRRALGASGSDVVSMVVRQGMTIAGIGVAAGLLGAFWLTGFMSSLLYQVGARDPATFVGVPLLLGGVALAATVLPAHRAVRVEPIVALREE
jgi:putative ABC transport system permease protein